MQQVETRWDFKIISAKSRRHFIAELIYGTYMGYANKNKARCVRATNPEAQRVDGPSRAAADEPKSPGGVTEFILFCAIVNQKKSTFFTAPSLAGAVAVARRRASA
jgi:hypothetical protein